MTIQERLASLGMYFDGERLRIAEALVDAHTASPDSLHDIQLMTIAVEAYRGPGSPDLV